MAAASIENKKSVKNGRFWPKKKKTCEERIAGLHRGFGGATSAHVDPRKTNIWKPKKAAFGKGKKPSTQTPPILKGFQPFVFSGVFFVGSYRYSRWEASANIT